MEYTEHIENEYWSLQNIDTQKFINNPSNYRQFSEGLDILLGKYGYQGNMLCLKDKSDFLYKKYLDAGCKVSKKTIVSWFNNTHRPDTASRKKMFELCFALKLEIDDVYWFFHHVYFERPFVCRNYQEAIYYFCFRNNKPDYLYAQDLISNVATIIMKSEHAEEVIYTNVLKKSLDDIITEKDLYNFFINNAAQFNLENVSALTLLKNLLDKTRGKKEDREIIEQFKINPEIIHDNRIRSCGYVIQDALKDLYLKTIYESKDSIDRIYKDSIFSHKQIDSDDFMLLQMLQNTGKSTAASFIKSSPLPEYVKVNFPNKKTLSNILSNSGKSSYDSIRKLLILLSFYELCVMYIMNGSSWCDFYDDFTDIVNDRLNSSGYDELFLGNPYDLLFLTCIKETMDADISGENPKEISLSYNPLENFRSIINERAGNE